MTTPVERTVRQLQRTPFHRGSIIRNAVTYANAGAFCNPQPDATPAQREAWARRWLVLYDTAARFEGRED